MNKDIIVHIEASQGIHLLEPLSVDCVVTSPPYYQLRSYLPDSHPYKLLELGLEPTPERFVSQLAQILHEFWPKMKSKGTMWVVLGDTFLGYGKGSGGSKCKSKMKESFDQKQLATFKQSGWRKPKQLALIPERFAIEMQNFGWLLRGKIIWHKPSCIPNNVNDRFMMDYETVLFFSKTGQYDFNLQLEEYLSSLNRWGGDKMKPGKAQNWDKGTGQSTSRQRDIRPNSNGRIMRSVWSINPSGIAESNTACFPEELVERCISAGTSLGGLVVDPFVGCGTTAVVAKKLSRHYIGFDIDEKSIAMAEARINLAHAEKTYRRLLPPKLKK